MLTRRNTSHLWCNLRKDKLTLNPYDLKNIITAEKKNYLVLSQKPLSVLSLSLSLRIYECNKRCKCCSQMCTNRLVQHGLQVRLQLFKTQNKGWGIRCLDDVAKGSFVCIYAGEEREGI